MAKITLDLNTFKASGIYTVEFDASQQIVISTQTVRLVPGFSRVGPFNAPVFLQDIRTARRIFGGIDSFLEKRGSFFHRALEICLSTGPVFALNLLPLNNVPVNEGGDSVTYRSFSLASDGDNGELTTALLASFFNKERFWFPDTKYLQATADSNFANKDRLFNVVNLSQKPMSVIIRKSVNAAQYNITAKDYYGQGNIPDYIKPNDFLSDYFVDVIAIAGDWSDLPYLSQDPVYSKYFDQRGVKVDQLSAFLGSDLVTLIGSFSGCVIPDFIDNNGTNQSIQTLVNNAFGLTGLFLDVNAKMLDDYANSPYKVDLVGHNLINTTDDVINFLSYNTPLSSELIYNDTEVGTTSNEWHNSPSWKQFDKGSTSPYVISFPYGNNNRTGNWFNTLVVEKPAPNDTVFTPSMYDSIARSLTNISLVRSQGSTWPVDDFVKVENVVDTGTSLMIQLSSPGWYPNNSLPASVFETVAFSVPSTATGITINSFTVTPAAGDFILVEAPGVKKYYQVSGAVNGGATTTVTVVAPTSGGPYFADKWCSNPAGDGLALNFGDFIQPNDIKATLYQASVSPTTNNLIPDLSNVGAELEFVFNPDIVYSTPNSSFSAETITGVGTDTIEVASTTTAVEGALIYSDNVAGITAGTRVLSIAYNTPAPGTDTITLSKPLPTANPVVPTDTIYFRSYAVEAYPGSKLAKNITTSIIVNGDKVMYAGSPVSAVNYLGVTKKYSREGLAGTNDSTSIIGYGLVGSALQEFDDASLTKLTTLNWVGVNESYEIGGGAPYDPSPVEANLVLYSASASSISDNVTIVGSLYGGGKKLLTDATNGAKISVGEFLVTNDINNPTLTRVVSKVKKINPQSGATQYEFTVLDIPSVNTSNQVTRFKNIQEFCDRLQFTYLRGFKLTDFHLPNNTESQVYKIYGVLEDTNLTDVLSSRDIISFRYIIDTFGKGLAPMMGSKTFLSRLAKKRQKCLALLNAPSISEFIASTDPRFSEEPDAQAGNPAPILNTGYIAQGGNLSLGPSYLFSLPDEDQGAKFIGVFSPFITIRENSKNLEIPPAADVSNNFIRKFINGTPYAIVAGPRRGVISNPKQVGLEYEFLLSDRENLEPMGINPIVTVKGVGPMIYANQSAYQKTLSAFNNLHVRDLLITVEEAVEDVLGNYLFEFNDASTRLEIRTIVENYLDTVRNAGGIYDFAVIMDDSNNTPAIIDQNFGILDIGIEPARGLQKFVNRITILKTGTISSGGFSAV